MTEHEMWQIVARVLGTTMKKVVLPATLGLGLTLSAGCDERAVQSRVDQGSESEEMGIMSPLYAAPHPADGGILEQDWGGAVARYGASFEPDGGFDPGIQPDYMASFPEPDTGVSARYAASFPEKDAG